MSDVPTSTHTTSRRNHHHHHHQQQHHRRGQPSRSSLRSSANSRPETPLILSSFKPNIIPSISQPTPEEIQRDVDIVFHSMGLDSASPIRHGQQQQHHQPYVNQEQEEEED